jgi:hypothetical protein
LRLAHFLDNQLTDDGKASFMLCPAALYTQGDSWYSFLSEVELTPGNIMHLEELDQLRNQMTSSIRIPSPSYIAFYE